MAREITLGNRFWSKVEKAGPDECWEWRGSKTNFGHGKFSWGHSNWILAHHVVFFLAHGRWPILQVCHDCDNPSCNNEKHLFEGTQLDNMRDASKKGRLNRPHHAAAGEGNHQSKLTWAIVERIRWERVNHGTSLGRLAEKFRISKRTILNVVHNETWRVAPPLHS